MSFFHHADGTAVHTPFAGLAMRWFSAMVRHYKLHAPEHVGMFAGSLLQREDWDH